MGLFQGFVRLGGTLPGSHVVRDASGAPAAADGDVTLAVYGPDGLVPATLAAAEADGTIEGLYHYRVPADPARGFDAAQSYRVAVSATTADGWSHLDVDSFDVT